MSGRQVWGLALPFSKFERRRSLRGDSGTRRKPAGKPRTAGLRDPAREAKAQGEARGRVWLQGSARRGVATLGEGGLPFSPEGRGPVCREERARGGARERPDDVVTIPEEALE